MAEKMIEVPRAPTAGSPGLLMTNDQLAGLQGLDDLLYSFLTAGANFPKLLVVSKPVPFGTCQFGKTSIDYQFTLRDTGLHKGAWEADEVFKLFFRGVGFTLLIDGEQTSMMPMK